MHKKPFLYAVAYVTPPLIYLRHYVLSYRTAIFSHPKKQF